MNIKANAKINIGLNVLSKRNDGYHNLESVFMPISLADDISITKLPTGFQTIVKTNISSLNNESNIIYKAIAILRQFVYFEDAFQILVTKNIPIGSGMGGGTSDAVAVMKAIIEMSHLSISEDKLSRIYSLIGADAHFFRENVPSLVTSIGDNVTPIKSKKSSYVLLVKPRESLSTKTVFDNYDKENCRRSWNIHNVVEALRVGDLSIIKEGICNSLQAPAYKLLPELEQIEAKLKETLPNAIISMTGSGSTLYALCKTEYKLKSLEKYFTKLGYFSTIAKTVKN